MDIALPTFILGYHGCDRKLAEDIYTGKETLKPSENKYDWLGTGIYFWEHNPQRAYEFACEVISSPRNKNQKINEPAVVGAVINLGNCLNLLDARNLELVKNSYEIMKDSIRLYRKRMPRNIGGKDLLQRNLDCAVINALHEHHKTANLMAYDTVRAAFVEGRPLYKNAGFHEKNHIQIAVRETKCIIGYFRPLDVK
ncbi:MAG: hypothetical protein HC898_12750 [Phycisphaerales bacterium]|nr:hypothetical protein [Phycisphaerales bacterium]